MRSIGNRARVRREDRPRRRRLRLRQHALLHLQILEHRLDHDARAREAGIVDRSANERELILELPLRDALPLELLAQNGAHFPEPLPHALVLRVLEPHHRPLHRRDRRDPRAHESGAEDADLLDRQRRHLASPTPVSFLSAAPAKKRKISWRLTSVTAISPNRPRFRRESLRAIAEERLLDRVDRRERRGIIPLRRRARRLARLPEHHRAPERIVLEHHIANAVHRTPALARDLPVGELRRAIERNVEQDRRMHELIDQPDLQRLLRAHALPLQNHLERLSQPDAPRQPLRSAGARDQPELHLREARAPSSDDPSRCDTTPRAPPRARHPRTSRESRTPPARAASRADSSSPAPLGSTPPPPQPCAAREIPRCPRPQ